MSCCEVDGHEICVDTNSDESHCGACNRPCRSDQICHNSSCTCSGQTTECNGACVDYQTDEENCGSCGNACENNETCEQGSCTPMDEHDADGDGFIGEEWGGDDCDDTNPDVNPDGLEGPMGDVSCSDSLDNDCDSFTDIQDPACCGCLMGAEPIGRRVVLFFRGSI